MTIKIKRINNKKIINFDLYMKAYKSWESFSISCNKISNDLELKQISFTMNKNFSELNDLIRRKINDKTFEIKYGKKTE
jgi:hypothetical protein